MEITGKRPPRIILTICRFLTTAETSSEETTKMLSSFFLFFNLAAVAPQVSSCRLVLITATVQEARNRSQWPGNVQRTQFLSDPKVQRSSFQFLVLCIAKTVQFFPFPIWNVQFGAVGRLQCRRRVWRCWRWRESQFDLLVASRDRDLNGSVRQRGGRRLEGHGTVHVSNQVDNLPLVVDAFFRRDGLLLFSPPMEVGDYEDATSADAHSCQRHRADEDDVEVDRAVGRIRHCA